MNNKPVSLTTFFLLLVAVPLTANASGSCPLDPPNTFMGRDFYEFDGREYEVVLLHPGDDFSWDAARTAASALVNADGFAGQLATLTSPAEDEFVRQLNAAECLNTSKELWVGGFQEDGSVEPAQGWQWINGELINPTNTLNPYTNWDDDEPNDDGMGEQHLGIGLKGFDAHNYGWNDEGRLGNIGGYVVEYGDEIEVDPTDCEAGGEGCDIGGAVTTLPPEAEVDPGQDATVLSIRINGDDDRCNNPSRFPEPLVLFGGEVVIPPYLCGSPDLIVLKTDAPGVDVPDGTVFVTNNTEELLPNNLYDCEGPINQALLSAVDPQFRDVVAWQDDDAGQMVETNPSVGGTGRFEGSVTEVTNECASSKGRTRGYSYYFIGLSINFGPNADLDENAAFNFDSFVELTRYKLTLLRQSVKDARRARAISRRDFRVLLFKVNYAIRKLDRGRYWLALWKIRHFLNYGF